MAPRGGRCDLPDTFARDPALRGWQPEQRRSEIEEPWSTYHSGPRLGQLCLAPARRTYRPARFPISAMPAAVTGWSRADPDVLAARLPGGVPALRPGRRDLWSWLSSRCWPSPTATTPGCAAPPRLSATPSAPGTPTRRAKGTPPARAHSRLPRRQRPEPPAAGPRTPAGKPPSGGTSPAEARQCTHPRLATAGDSKALRTVPVHADLRRCAWPDKGPKGPAPASRATTTKYTLVRNAPKAGKPNVRIRARVPRRDPMPCSR